MKVLFVYPNILMVNRVPLGIAYLSSILKWIGHEVRLFDTTFYRSGDETDDTVFNYLVERYKEQFADAG